VSEAPARASRPLLATVLAAALAMSGALVALGFTSDHLELPGLHLAGCLFVAWSFVGVGLYAWWRRPENRFGVIMIAAGFAWLVSALAVSDVPVLFSLGVSLSVLYIATIVHLLLAFPTGRLEDKSDRELAIGAYVVTTVLVMPGLLFLDFSAGNCDGCPDNVFLVAESQTAFDVIDIVTSVLGAVLVFEVGRSLWRRRAAAAPHQRHALAPVLAAGLFATTALGVTLVLDVAGAGSVSGVAAALGLAGLAAVPWCFLLGLARTAVTRGGVVGRLVARLGDTLGPDDLRSALAEALGDPTLEIAYWIPESGRYVDGTGRELAGEAGEGRTTTPVELEGRRVGALVHDARLLDQPELVRAVADAAALALERERLEAELRAKVEELRASRARIVEAGYAAARRLERDLHDGAQQRLVSLALGLRMAEGRVESNPEEAQRLLRSAHAELDAAIAELRDFARGLHPGILADRGLDAALSALAARAPLPVEVEGSAEGRLNPGVESAAYFVVAEALTNVAKYAEAETATVSVARDNGALTVQVRDDGVGGADPANGSGLRGLSDRVSALDGRLEVESPSDRGTLVRARIPVGDSRAG
jgi:signal transduction histidine kinase